MSAPLAVGTLVALVSPHLLSRRFDPIEPGSLGYITHDLGPSSRLFCAHAWCQEALRTSPTGTIRRYRVCFNLCAPRGSTFVLSEAAIRPVEEAC